MDRLAEFAMTKAGLADAIRLATSTPGGPEKPTHTPVTDAAELLLRANDAVGAIRPGMTPDDLILAIGGLWQLAPTDDWRPRAARLLDLVMDGLRAGAPGAAWPGSPVLTRALGGDRSADIWFLGRPEVRRPAGSEPSRPVGPGRSRTGLLGTPVGGTDRRAGGLSA